MQDFSEYIVFIEETEQGKTSILVLGGDEEDAITTVQNLGYNILFAVLKSKWEHQI